MLEGLGDPERPSHDTGQDHPVTIQPLTRILDNAARRSAPGRQGNDAPGGQPVRLANNDGGEIGLNTSVIRPPSSATIVESRRLAAQPS